MKLKLIPLIAVIATTTTQLTTAASLFGVTFDNNLVSFDSLNPGVFLTNVPISGLFGADGVTPNASGTILNLSARPGALPFTIQLYGIDDNANVYTINPDGAATLVSSGFSPTGFNAGFAYDPFNDNFVYAGDNAENFTIGLDGIATANLNLTYAGGGTPAIFGLGIDLGFGTAYAIDATNDSLSVSFNPLFPGDSELTLVGGLGVNVVSYGGLVVDWDGNLLASLSTDGVNSSLYSIDPLTGAATSIGSFGLGMSTIAVPEPSAALLGGLGLLALLRRRRP